MPYGFHKRNRIARDDGFKTSPKKIAGEEKSAGFGRWNLFVYAQTGTRKPISLNNHFLLMCG